MSVKVKMVQSPFVTSAGDVVSPPARNTVGVDALAGVPPRATGKPITPSASAAETESTLRTTPLRREERRAWEGVLMPR